MYSISASSFENETFFFLIVFVLVCQAAVAPSQQPAPADSQAFFQQAKKRPQRKDNSAAIEALLRRMTIAEKVGQMMTQLTIDMAPCKRVRRFAEVSLEPGQSATLTFEIKASELAFINASNRLVLEPGDFTAMIGGLSKRFAVK
jgi:hypothetical protein